MTNIKALLTGVCPLLLVLTLITPGTGLAHTGLRLLDDTPVPNEKPQSGPRLLELPPQDERTTSPATHVARIATEVGTVTLTSLIAAIPGTVIGLALCDSSPGPFGLGCMEYAAFGFLGGVTIGASIGAWAGARLVDGQGTFSGAFAGAAVGAGVGLGTVFLFSDIELLPVFLLAGPMLGAIVGYEWSHASNSRRDAAPEVSVQPTLAVGPGHTLLGMSGRF
ncbi:hypothetical protein [Comamonas sp. JC664]|uniref:hypothetical protein n=1 Tax=Comamonas sp. JC664 TaxID=2801917 RepID=UPI00174D1737|nr:hypothetical protein [Comamonas sp. JC664]MBL0694288.1 hypothetical protein [Comamonas sp. JC664]GHG76815.1 hypothetical protein GCM10012319_26190 [Comamonas sp. KCTC 72670]